MTEDTRTDLGWATQMSATRRYARWRNQRIAAAVTGITLVAGGLLAASTTPPAAADTGLTAPVQLNTDSNGIERTVRAGRPAAQHMEHSRWHAATRCIEFF